jgi:hypothetical protein
VIQPRPCEAMLPLRTLLPKTRTLLFCRLSSGERGRLLPSLPSCGLSPAKTLHNSPHKHANNMPADITPCGQPENTLSTPSQRVWEALSPACRAPSELGPNVMSISNSQPITVRPDLRTKVDTAVLCCLAHPPLQLSPRSGTSRHCAL